MSVEALFQNVYENPSDAACRRVLADALLQQGDPRGELIMLQFETHAVARKRAKKLVERHRARFLGALSDVVLHGTDVWEHGFLVSCWARLSGGTTECPAWATVRELSVVSGGELAPAELGSRWMRSLRAVRVLSAEERWWARKYELDAMRARLVNVLRAANRLHLLKA